MVYTAHRPPNAESSDQLRARIPGWGVDLDPKDRPSVPRERFDPGATGAHWEFPDRQPESWPRERSVEHQFLTPVFGTSCPPSGVSGRLRKYAYTLGEGRASRWLILLGADRVDVVESRARGVLAGHPDTLLPSTGLRSELSHHGVASRLRRRRADLSHQPLDPFVAGAPWLVVAGVGYAVLRRRRRR